MANKWQKSCRYYSKVEVAVIFDLDFSPIIEYRRPFSLLRAKARHMEIGSHPTHHFDPVQEVELHNLKIWRLRFKVENRPRAPPHVPEETAELLFGQWPRLWRSAACLPH